jgi:hypothetical protein
MDFPVSASDVRRFMEDPVWLYIQEMLDDRIDMLHVDLEVAPMESIYRAGEIGGVGKVSSIDEIRGSISEVRKFKRLPEVLLSKIENKTEQEDKNE